MTTITQRNGYLTEPYRSGPYLAGAANAADGFQVELIVASTPSTGFQAEGQIVRASDDPHVAFQVEMVVDTETATGFQAESRVFIQPKTGFQVEGQIIGAGDDPHVGVQTDMFIDTETATGFQVDNIFKGTESFVGFQAEGQIVGEGDDPHIGFETEMQIVEQQPTVGMQILGQIVSPSDDPQVGFQTEAVVEGKLAPEGVQVKIEFPQIIQHPKYNVADEGYLTNGYLAQKVCALLGMQVELRNFVRAATGMQVDRKIVGEGDDPHVGMQVEGRIENKLGPTGMQILGQIIRESDDPHIGMQVEGQIVGEGDDPHVGMQILARIEDKLAPTGFEVEKIQLETVGMQATLVLYNTTQIRFLCEFISRGTAALGGQNWTSIQTTESGDLGDVNNLNTDIVEQRVQTATGILNWELRCDSGETTFVDTIGILNHNFTQGATVRFEASNDVNFTTVEYTRVLNVEPENMYYVLPLADFPAPSARYYRLLVTDTGNGDQYLSIGTIVFGSSSVFSQQTTFDNPLRFGKVHFKDSVPTEGFTSVSNDRATRKTLSLSFTEIDVNSGDYSRIKQYVDETKTDLKCLIIPTPCDPSLFAVWSKLVQMPEETHNAIEVCGEKESHHVSLNLDWDESL